MNIIILKKLIVTQVLKKFPIVYVNRRFITVLRRANYWSLSRVNWIKSTPPHPLSLRSALILSSRVPQVRGEAYVNITANVNKRVIMNNNR
jgi:hypothetical protein